MEHTLVPEDFENDQDEFLDMYVAETQVESASVNMLMDDMDVDETSSKTLNDLQTMAEEEKLKVQTTLLSAYDSPEEIHNAPIETSVIPSESTPVVKDHDDSAISKIETSITAANESDQSTDSNDIDINEAIAVSNDKVSNNQDTEVAVLQNEIEVSEESENESEHEELDMHVSQTQVHADALMNVVADMELDENNVNHDINNDCSESNEQNNEQSSEQINERINERSTEQINEQSNEESKNAEDGEDYDNIDLHVSQTQVHAEASMVVVADENNVNHDVNNDCSKSSEQNNEQNNKENDEQNNEQINEQSNEQSNKESKNAEDDEDYDNIDLHVSQTQVQAEALMDVVADMELDENNVMNEDDCSERNEQNTEQNNDQNNNVYSEQNNERNTEQSNEESKNAEDDEDYDNIDLHVSQTQVNLPTDQLLSRILNDIDHPDEEAAEEKSDMKDDSSDNSEVDNNGKVIIQADISKDVPPTTNENENIKGSIADDLEVEKSDDFEEQDDDDDDDGEFINLYVTQSDGLIHPVLSQEHDSILSSTEDKNPRHTMSSLQYSSSAQPYSIPSPIVGYTNRAITVDNYQKEVAKTTKNQSERPTSGHETIPKISESDSPTQLDTYMDSYISASVAHEEGHDVIEATRLEDLNDNEPPTPEDSPSLNKNAAGKESMTEWQQRQPSVKSTNSNDTKADKVQSSNRESDDIEDINKEKDSDKDVTSDKEVNHSKKSNNVKIHEEENCWIDTRSSNSSSLVMKDVTSSMKKPFQVPIVTSPKRDYLMGIIPTSEESKTKATIVHNLKKDIGSPEKTTNIPDIWKLLNNLNSVKDSLTNDTIKELKQTLFSKLQELTSLEATISDSTDAAKSKLIEDIALSQQFGSEECALVLSNLNQSNAEKGKSKDQEPTASSSSSSCPPQLPPRRLFNTFHIETAGATTPTANGLAKDATPQQTPTPLRSDGRRKRKFGTPGSGGQQKSTAGGGVERNIFDFDYGNDSDDGHEKADTTDKLQKHIEIATVTASSTSGKVSKASIAGATGEITGTPSAPADRKKVEKVVSRSEATVEETKPTTEEKKEVHKPSSSVAKSDEVITVGMKVPAINNEQYPLAAFIPPSMIHSMPKQWALTWAELETVGWYWTKGKGLIDFYYIKPNCKPSKPYSMGIDYFGDTDSVLDFLKAEIGKYRVRNGLSYQTSKEANEKSTTKVKPIESEKKPNRLISHKNKNQADEVELISGSEDNNTSYGSEEEVEEFEDESQFQPAIKTKKAAKEQISKAKVSTVPRPLSASKNNSNSGNDKPDIRTILWKDLWKILRSIGWCWDFGPGLVNYFYQPGYDSKHDKDAVIGEHKFTGEDEVRRYIKQQMRWTYQSKSDKESKSSSSNAPSPSTVNEVDWWQYFSYVPSGSNNHDTASKSSSETKRNGQTTSLNHASSAAKSHPTIRKEAPSEWFGESQVNVIEDAHLTDPSWNLVTHRKKRDSAVNYHALDDPYRATQKRSIANREADDVVEDEGEDNEDEDFELHEKQKRNGHSTTPPPVNQQQHKKRKVHQGIIASTPDSITSEDLTPKQTIQQQKIVKDRTKSSFATQMHGTSSTATTLLNQISRPLSAAKESATNSKLLLGWSIVFSGIDEKPRERMEQLVNKFGGTVLSALPKEHITAHARGEADIPNIVLISQAKDFRKPKYIMSFLLGIPILHSHWLLDSIQQQKLQPLTSYILPISYSLLHSYYVYAPPILVDPSSSVIPSMIYYEQIPILQDMIVLNITGLKIWDQIITLCGGTVYTTPSGSSKDYELFIKSLLPPVTTQTASYPSKRIDFVLFDPILYTRSYIYHHQNHTTSNGSNGRPNTSSTSSSSSSEMKNILKPYELQLLQHYSNMNTTYTTIHSNAKPKVSRSHAATTEQQLTTPPTLVVSVDWLSHCVAIQQLINIHSSDLFTLPLDPLRHPIAYKSDMEYPTATTTAPSSSGSSSKVVGERYSKYDLVYYQPTTSGNNKELMMGKIIGFHRRNIESKLFLRIRPIESVSHTSSSVTGKSIYAILSLSPHPTVEEQTIPVSQLHGKVILLKQSDYLTYVPTAYATSSKPYLTSLLKETTSTAGSSTSDTYYAMSRALQQVWPIIPYEGSLEEEEVDEDDSDSPLSKKARNHQNPIPLRHQASQDF